MRVGRGLRLLAVGALVAAGSPAIGVSAAAAPPSKIYVAKSCGSAPDGSVSKPFCAISQAVAVAVAGQTIEVGTGSYNENVVPRSGEPGKPITIAAAPGKGNAVQVGPGNATEAVFRLSGVHDVVIDGFNIGGVGPAAVLVEDSTDVTVSSGWVLSPYGPGVEIKGASRRVTITGMSMQALRAPAFAVGAGAADTRIAASNVWSKRLAGLPAYAAISVADAPRTTVVNNSIMTDCLAGVEVTGASPGFALVNSIVQTTFGTLGTCTAPSAPDPASVRPVTVAAPATADSLLDYNVIDPRLGGPLYSWAGTTYADPGTFHSATGQAAHDIGADPRMTSSGDYFRSGFTLAADSPAIDSAWVAAPGLSATDLRGNAHADKPDTPNSGGGYVDRGAVELVPTPSISSTIARAPGGGAFETITTVQRTYQWATDGPIGAFIISNGPERVVNNTGIARFSFDRAGPACTTVQFSVDGFRTPSATIMDAPCVFLGGAYTAVTPQRVLDTRSKIGVPGTTPVASGAEAVFALPAAAANASAVVLNVTATQPTTAGFLKVYGDGDFLPNAADLHFASGQTIATLVTVKVRNGMVRIWNSGPGTTHLLADLWGNYGNPGNGFQANTPVRVMDTRSAVGVPTTTPVAANGKVTFDVSTRVPAGTTAVALNLNILNATKSGQVTAYPAGGAVPATPNATFAAGKNMTTMVIAPVVGGKVALAHTGTGTVHLVADLAGSFAPSARDTYLPTSPSRRANASVAAGQTLRVYVSKAECGSDPCTARTALANVTASGATQTGCLTAYPYGQTRPNASVISYAAGQTVSSLVAVGLSQDSFLLYNCGRAAVQVTVDQAGFYLAGA
ncbi:right-handed parallel beta-helix repeat-containing protein [Asanoa iriomotensis]|uniref:DUF1565 domain-containing protein n=1 Tax=Asanoa iriomotensis TaxID=234613 RepID=A0ABQ4C4Z2_9ACTN|nr:right-handed parallel beta-helix repeat-containing protein [Asanoa iriomotensis]GIF57847.1 hypothetical protein Air01nite_39420 [Asanoa iriomotensis]